MGYGRGQVDKRKEVINIEGVKKSVIRKKCRI
jgi:hypothetical protein